MSRKIAHVFAVLCIVNGDDTRITRRGHSSTSRRYRYCSDGLCETCGCMLDVKKLKEVKEKV